MTVEARFEPIERKRAHEAVVDQIQREILDGRIRPGDQLPGERDLSEMLGVSRTSVREALRVLETLQILDIPTKRGPDSSVVVAARSGDTLSRILQLQVALDGYSTSDVVHIRRGLEELAAQAAAEHRSDTNLTEMQRLLEAMETGGHDPASFNELDMQFHLLVAEASGNRLLHYLMGALRDSMTREMRQRARALPDFEGRVGDWCQDHRSIFEAIRDRDPEAATAAVRAHLKPKTVGYSPPPG